MRSFMVGDGPASPGFLSFLLREKHPEHRAHVVEQDSLATRTLGVVFPRVAVEAIEAAAEEIFRGVIRGQVSCKFVRKRQGAHTHGNPCPHTSRLGVLAELECACERSEVGTAHGDIPGAKEQSIGFMATRFLERKM